MQFFSTRDTNRKVTSSEAIAQGLSDEGGLFVPESFPQVDVRALCELDYPALAAAVIREYLTDYSPEFLAQAARTHDEHLRCLHTLLSLNANLIEHDVARVAQKLVVGHGRVGSQRCTNTGRRIANKTA